MDGGGDAAGSLYMIILNQYAVGEIVAVVIRAAHADCVFFYDAKPRGSLARVQYMGFIACKLGLYLVCIGGYAAHPLHEVECYAFTG